MKRSIYTLAACCLLASSPVSAQTRSLDHLLTNETVFVWSWSGEESTADAYRQTASYKAFHESGLVPAFSRLGNSIPWTQLVAASGEEYPISWSQLKLAWNHVQIHGAAVSIGIRGDDAQNSRPYGLLVVPQAGPVAPAIEQFYRLLEQFEQNGGGSVPELDFPGIKRSPLKFPFKTIYHSPGSTTPPATFSLPVSPQEQSDNVFVIKRSRAAPLSAPADSPDLPVPVNAEISNPRGRGPHLPTDQISLDKAEAREIIERWEQIWFQDTDAPLRAPRPVPSKAPEAGWKIEKSTIGEREIYHLSGPLDPDFPTLELAWWAEGDDLVLYYGMSPVTEYLKSLEDKDNQLAGAELWNSSFETSNAEPQAGNLAETSRVWLNIERFVQLYADFPIDDPEIPFKTIRELMEPSGLLGLRAIGWRSGFRGQNLVSISRVVTESPRRGLLSLLDETSFTLDDLPPLPANVSTFTAGTIDFGKTYREIQNVFDQYLKLAGPAGQLYWQMIKQQTPALDGFDLEQNLFAHLGHVVVTYSDSEQEVLGWGTSAVAIAVTDPEALLAGINRWRDSNNEDARSKIRIVRRERRGYTIFAVTSSESFLSPSFAVSGNWLVIGWQPQTVEAFQLRTAGRLPAWSPDNLAEENRGLTAQKFQQLEYSDPRSTVRTLVSLAPWLLEGIRYASDQIAETGIEWHPEVSSLDIPPAELIVEPLYPNLTVTRRSDTVIHTERWASSNVDQSAWWLLGAYCGLAMFAE